MTKTIVPARDWPWRAALAAAILGYPVLLAVGACPAVATCLFKDLWGIPCPTCGYTRFSFFMLRGHPLAAVRFQPFMLPLILVGLSYQGDLAPKSARVRALLLSSLLAASWGWNLAHGI